MAYYSDDDVDYDTGFLLLVIVGGYVAYNYFRNQQAAVAESGGLEFQNYAPAGGDFGDTIQILSPLQVSPSGASFIMQREGFAPTPAPDAGGQVIGYGHTIQPGENYAGGISQADAQALLEQDLEQTAAVLNNAILVEVSQDQFDALASLEYNIGPSAFQNSTLLRLLNSGDYAGASAQFAAWNKSQGQVNAGLVARRDAESNLFNS